MLQALVDPVLVRVDYDGREVGSCPLFGSLLNELDQISSVLVVPNQMSLIDDQNERSTDGRAPFQCDLLQLIESSFNIENGGCVARPADGEQSTDIVLVELKVQRATQADAEDLGIGMGF